jgi:hypothetical protein
MPKMKGQRPQPGMNAGLMERLAKLQDDMKEAHEALGQERLTVSAGGDAVKVVIDGQQHLHEIQIAPEALADREMLQDMLVAAINNALEQSQTLAAQRMQGLSGALGLPGM